MNKKVELKTLLLLSTLFVCVPVITSAEEEGTATAITEVSCSSDVSFVWRRGPTEKEIAEAVKTKKKLIEPSPTPVFFKKIIAIAPTEDQAKKQLQEDEKNVQSEALRACEEHYASPSSCISKGLKKMHGELQLMTYEARKVYLASLQTECDQLTGVCIEVKSSAPVCLTRNVENSADAAAEADKTKKKK